MYLWYFLIVLKQRFIHCVKASQPNQINELERINVDLVNGRVEIINDLYLVTQFMTFNYYMDTL